METNAPAAREDCDLKLILLLLLYLAILGTPLAGWWLFRQLAKLAERSAAALMALCLLAALSTPAANAQTLIKWTNGANDGIWENAANFTPATVPDLTNDVEIVAPPPAGTLIMPKTVTIKSLTIAAACWEPLQIGSMSNGQLDPEAILQVNGDIRNYSGNPVSFWQSVADGTVATWSGSLDFRSNVSIGAGKITVLDAPTFSLLDTQQTLAITMNSLQTYGQLLGPAVIDFSGVHLSIAGHYVGQTGDVFHLSSGGFYGITVDALPTLSSGYTWDTSQLESMGVLAVHGVPEPSTYGSLIVACGMFLILKNPRFRPRFRARFRLRK